MNARVRRILKRSAIAANRILGPIARRLGLNPKELYEYAYWRSRLSEEKTLGNAMYEPMFTSAVGLTRDFYDGCRILDVGCGPRGSLEWADNAGERVGIDSLVGKYRKLGIDSHRMRYVEAGAESIPFEDGYFDVVTSFNALDHVDDVEQATQEMLRTLRPGGTLIVVVDIHAHPTVAEPHAIPWEFAKRLAEDLDVCDERHLEKRRGHDYLNDQVPFDHANSADRYGSLVVRGVKKPVAVPS